MKLNDVLNKPRLRWLMPGLQLKRWLGLMMLGVALIGLGLGYVLVQLYRDFTFPPAAYYLTLQFLLRVLRAVLVGGAGLACLWIGFVQFNKSVVRSLRANNDTQPMLDKLWQQRIAKPETGPNIVSIGGGHGMAALLKGLKTKTKNITAIVTVADDGGSSGRIRRDLGLLPPGDFRMCISALADDDSLVTQLFQYRFGKSANGENGLSGHSFGNLFIAAMAELTGSFEKALIESSRVVASTGRIVPSTLSDVTLCAEFALPANAPAHTPTQARGESSIGKMGLPIERVWLEPNAVAPFPEAVRAILQAELVVMGPGSLFTSVMPNLLVPGIADALRETAAKVVYICNVATERGETDGFSVDQHIDAIERHIGKGIVDFVVVNNRVDTGFNPPEGVTIVQPIHKLLHSSAQTLLANVVDDETPWRHNSTKLADVALGVIQPKRA